MQKYIFPFVSVFRDVLKYPFTKGHNPDHLDDIQNGMVYQSLMAPGKFLSFIEHIGLILNTDGVAVYKSSKFSLWPIYLALANLPPHLRMRKDFILLAGWWYGPIKPNMDLILHPVLEEIHYLQCTGFDLHVQGEVKRIRAMLLCGIFDLPAKALAVNMKQFNGQYGCLDCTHPGRSIRPGLLVYPPNTQSQARTHSEIQQCAHRAAMTGDCVYGIKGECSLAPFINLVKCIPIDYMHAVLEGVTKQFLSMWITTKNHKSSFYLGKKLKDVDRLLVTVRPPCSFRRSPRAIGSSFNFGKPVNYVHGFYIIHCQLSSCIYLLHYVHHWSLLVFSIHALLGMSIEKNHLPLINDTLKMFHLMTEELYGIEACTANLHSLLHLTDFVQLWGPLWTHSLFGFESMNGHVRKYFHGTQQILDQLAFSVMAEQSIFLKTQELSNAERRLFQ